MGYRSTATAETTPQRLQLKGVQKTSFEWVGSGAMVVIDSALVVMIILDIIESSNSAPLRFSNTLERR